MDQKAPKPLTVQIVQHLRPGGIEMLALEFLRHQSDNSSTHLISLEGTAEETFQQWSKLKDYADQITFLNKPQGIHIPTLFKLTKLFREWNANSIHTHHIGPLLYAGMAARLAGCQNLIHTEHDSWHLQQESERKLQGTLLRLLRPKLVADSQHVARELDRFYPFSQSEVILNGIDTTRFIPGDKLNARKALALPKNAKLIGCAARLETVKNHSLIFQALRKLPKEYHLALAGSGSLEEPLKHQATILDITERVHFLGHVDDIVSFYQSLDAFCLPSLKEGLPLSLLEAQAVDVPVIASDVGSCREALAPQKSQLFPSNNLPALLESVEGIFKADASPQTRSFVLEQFSLNKMIESYQSLCVTTMRGISS